jgi:hypothetical protein
MNTYLSWFDWQKTTTGLEYASLVGNTGWVDASASIGATAITVYPATTVQINKYDVITIFDGQFSETITATAEVNVGATSIPTTATAYAHAVGTPYCTDGVSGSLADQIIKASTYLETICRQTLFLTTYADEKLAMPTMRGSIDNHYALHFRPRHWPVQTITSLTITQIPNFSISYDPTQVVIDSDKQICMMPDMQPLPTIGSGQAPYPIWNVQSRYAEAQLTITYQAGFAVIPADVIEAAVLLTSDTLAKRLNPYGAPEVKSGQRQIVANIKSEVSGQSLLFKRAKMILDNYTMQSF